MNEYENNDSKLIESNIDIADFSTQQSLNSASKILNQQIANSTHSESKTESVTNISNNVNLKYNLNNNIKPVSSHNTILSINTDYTTMTKQIMVKHTKHSYERALKRIIDDDMIKKCLKYGKKEEQLDGKIKFCKGDLTVVKANANQNSAVVTTFQK